MRHDELESELNMSNASRKDDIDTGHGSRPATSAIEGSGDVNVNGRPVMMSCNSGERDRQNKVRCNTGFEKAGDSALHRKRLAGAWPGNDANACVRC